MRVTRRELRQIIREFRSSLDVGDVDITGIGDDFPPVEPPDDEGGGGGGGGDGNNWFRVYEKMQRELTPLLIDYYSSGQSDASALEAFVNFDNPLWRELVKGPFSDDPNFELPGEFLECILEAPWETLGSALFRTQDDGIPIAEKITNFVSGMLLIDRESGQFTDFLMFVSHLWEPGVEDIANIFIDAIITMFNQDRGWPNIFMGR